MLQLHDPWFNPDLGFLYILPVSVWVSYKFCSFLPPPKNMQVENAKLPTGLNKCLNVCMIGLSTNMYSCLIPSVFWYRLKIFHSPDQDQVISKDK